MWAHTRGEVGKLLLSYIRTMLLFLVLIFAVRLMGKRQVGQMEPAEFVVTMLIANLASIPMQEEGIPLLLGLVPILTVLGMQLLLAVGTMRSIGLRRLLCGKPVILIHEGVILQRNLRRASINLDELTEHLREREVLDLSTVQYAILETNGQLSVFPYTWNQPASAKDAGQKVPAQSLPVTIVSDGKLVEENLTASGRDRAWLGHELRARGSTVAQTYLLTVDGNGKVFYVRKEAEA